MADQLKIAVKKTQVKKMQRVTLMAAAIRVLDQHRARLSKADGDEASCAAARRAVMILDDLLWDRPINFGEAVDLLTRASS